MPEHHDLLLDSAVIKISHHQPSPSIQLLSYLQVLEYVPFTPAGRPAVITEEDKYWKNPWCFLATTDLSNCNRASDMTAWEQSPPSITNAEKQRSNQISLMSTIFTALAAVWLSWYNVLLVPVSDTRTSLRWTHLKTTIIHSSI